MERAQSPALPERHKGETCCNELTASMSSRQASVLAERLKVLGDETRLRILDLLVQQREAICVCDLTPHFDQNQPTISHHLRLLRDAGLIETEKRGIWSYYWPTATGRRSLSMLRDIA